MSAADLVERAFAPVREHIASGRIPGGVLGVVTASGERAVLVDGAAQIDPDHRHLTRETIFDLASLTKVIFTTPRILALAREGRIDLDAPLTTIIPDFRQYDANAWERKVTFRQCLGHQTLFPGVEPIYTYGGDPNTLRAFVLQREWRQLEAPVYSDINFILLGIALERIAGHGIRDFALPHGLDLVARSGEHRGDRVLRLARPRDGRRGARRELLCAAGHRPRRALRHHRCGARLRQDADRRQQSGRAR